MELTTVLENTRALLGNVRQKLVKVAANLVILREKETRTWAEVCEDLDISQGFASKLTSSYTHYVLEGGIAPERLEGIDNEKLYLASKTEGSTEEQLARASTLTRGELKLEKSENEPHTPDFKEVCTTCWVSKENHG